MAHGTVPFGKPDRRSVEVMCGRIGRPTTPDNVLGPAGRPAIAINSAHCGDTGETSPAHHLRGKNSTCGDCHAAWRCGRSQEESAGRLILRPPALCFTPDSPHNLRQASCGLSESCSKNGDVPKSPFVTVAAVVPSAGTIMLLKQTFVCGCDQHPHSARAACGARSSHSMVRAKGTVMQLPEILHGESLTRLLQGAVVGFLVTVIVGFNWGGWTLESTAKQMADKSANAALVAALAPMCADKFEQASGASLNLAELKKVSSWMQDSYIEKGGWATFPGMASPERGVAEACANLLTALK